MNHYQNMLLKSAENILNTLLVLLILIPIVSRADSFVYNGELAALTTVERDTDDQLAGTASLRYLPQLEKSWHVTGFTGLRTEMAGVVRGSIARTDELTGDFELDLYRCWLRLDRPSWELRAGLQKLNFGPARLLRVLRWFDTVNPGDPTGYTKGVTGLSLRVTPTPRSTLRGWMLIDDSDTQLLETRRSTVAGGGRIQLPLGRGELALTGHTRLLKDSGRENRIALDGSWDLGVGLWFESLLQHNENVEQAPWSSLTCCGLDYTFDWGNGLHLLSELLVAQSGFDLPGGGGNVLQSHFTAFMVDYPLTIFDSLSLLALLDNESSSLLMLDWGHLTDYWSLHLQGFLSDSVNSNALALSENTPENGVRLLVIYNH
jgi:hypothetical protein